VSDGFWNCLSQINMMKIIASATLQRHPQHPNATRHALEQSILYSEELGIDLARGTDAVCFHWFLASLLFGGPNFGDDS
jgi:hypothetical protein